MSQNTLRKNLIILLALSASIPAHAATNGELDYPELVVTPRASERLATESAKEHDRRWVQWIPVQVSSVSTILASVYFKANSPDSDYASKPGLLVGGVGLIGSVTAALLWHPYQSGMEEIAPLPAKTQREQLIRERAAEEAMVSASAISKKVAYISTIANFGANVLMITKAEKGSAGFGIAAAGAVLSFTPLLFENSYQRIWSQQQNYKKRTYGPIAMFDLIQDQTGNRAPVPGLRLAFRF